MLSAAALAGASNWVAKLGALVATLKQAEHAQKKCCLHHYVAGARHLPMYEIKIASKRQVMPESHARTQQTVQPDQSVGLMWLITRKRMRQVEHTATNQTRLCITQTAAGT